MSTVKKISQVYSKHVTLLNMIKLWRFLYGYCVYFNCSNRVKWANMIYCFTLIAIVTSNCWDVILTPHAFNVFEYYLAIILSLFTGDKYFYKFCSMTATNDVIMGNKISLFGIGVKITVVLFLVFRIILFSINIAILSGLNMRLVKIAFIVSASRFNCVMAAIVFLLMYTRIKIIRRRLERNIIPVNIISQNEIVGKVREVRRCLLHYNNLLDNFLDADEELQYLLCITMFFSVPKFVVSTYSLITECTRYDCNALLFVGKVLGVLDGLALSCWPAVVAELIKYECERMIQELSKQLIRCSDESLCFELKIALQYMKQRPFNYVLCGAVPLNIFVPINSISLTITYVIVVIQFTHFANN